MVPATARFLFGVVVFQAHLIMARRTESDLQHAMDVEDVSSPSPLYRDWYSHPGRGDDYYHAPAIRYVDAEEIDQAQMMDGLACFCKKAWALSVI